MTNHNTPSPDDKQTALLHEALHLPLWQLTQRQQCDAELLMNGAFAPLDGFLGKADYQSVVSDMRLADGRLWPIPVTLDVTPQFAEPLSPGDRITLRDEENFALAVMTVQDIWKPNLRQESEAVYGTLNESHSGAHHLLHSSHPIYLGGQLEKLNLPHHVDYPQHRHTPAQLKQLFKHNGWSRIVAFQTRNPMHRAHIELTKKAMRDTDARLLIHPVVGVTQINDIDYHTRVHCYRAVLDEYPPDNVAMSLLPLAMRMAGPREALWHGLIRKNYGCTHFIIGRDHAGPRKGSRGESFYRPFEAQEMFIQHADEIGIEPVAFQEIAYDPEKREYTFADDAGRSSAKLLTISGTKMREMLANGETLPEWFTPAKVAKVLRRTYPPLKKRGFTVFFTGLSGAGKTTLAKMLVTKLLEQGEKQVTLLDGDIVRTHLSSELGFSKEHRSINVRRIGFVAGEITKNGGIAICAPIAPYEADRRANRRLISHYGIYVEVYVSTPLKVCEERDVKGYYRSARQNLTKSFTGISDPYEVPTHPEIAVDTSAGTPEELVNRIYERIRETGCL